MCRYLKTWFIIDLLASIPFAWFISDDDLYNDDGELIRSDALVHHTSQLLRLLKIVRFMRIIRMIRLFKLRGLVNRVSEFYLNNSLVRRSLLQRYRLDIHVPVESFLCYILSGALGCMHLFLYFRDRKVRRAKELDY